MAEHFRGTGIILRFIEYMDVGTTNGWRMDDVVPAAELVDRLIGPLAARAGRAATTRARSPTATATSTAPARSASSPRSRSPFCGDCTRARLSAEGELYTCLFAAARPRPARAAARRRDRRASWRRCWAGSGAAAPTATPSCAPPRRRDRAEGRDVAHRRLTHAARRGRRSATIGLPSAMADVGHLRGPAERVASASQGVARLPAPAGAVRGRRPAVRDLRAPSPEGDWRTAFVHARDVVSVEQTLGIFNELDVQQWALPRPWVLDVANLTYFHAHFVVTTVLHVLALPAPQPPLLLHPQHRLRRPMAIALVGYIALPDRAAADADRPRLHRHAREVRADVNSTPAPCRCSRNPFAAVPSVHTCFSLIIGALAASSSCGAGRCA